jgi:hypothetical protein
MKTFSISIILFLIASISHQAKELRVFSPSSYIESTDGQHVIFSGNSDYSNGVTTALVFNTDDYSYHSFGIYLNDISPNKNTPITNATNNLLGYNTNSELKLFNYMSGEEIAKFEFDENYDLLEFSYEGTKLYTLDTNNKILRIYSIETEELLDLRVVDKLTSGYKVSSINQANDLILLIKNDSLATYSIADDAIVNRAHSGIVGTSTNYVAAETLIFGMSDEEFVYIDYDNLKITNRYENNLTVPEGGADLNFSKDCKYIHLFYGKNYLQTYDVVGDSILISVGDFTSRMFNLQYLSDDKKVGIGYEEAFYYCGRSLESPLNHRIGYIYDLESKKRIQPLPNTYVKSPRTAIYSDDNSKIAIAELERGISNDELMDEVYITKVVDEDTELLEYVYINSEPKLFLDNSKYIAYEEDQKLNFYNIADKKFEKSLDINLSGDVIYKYSVAHRKIVAYNDDTLKVFDYDKMTLDYEMSVFDAGLDSLFKYDGDFGLNSYSDFGFRKFNLLDKSTNSVTINNLPDGFETQDYSPNGRYLLARIDENTIGLYDVLFDVYKEHDISDYYNSISVTKYLKLKGNLPIYQHIYEDSPIFTKEYIAEYDFDTDEFDRRSFAPEEIVFSTDLKHQVSITCPDIVELETLRDPLTNIETQEIANNTIYPNPASSFIYLDQIDLDQLTNCRLYNSVGELVMDIGTIQTTKKLEIEYLPSGVYFLHSNEFSVSFVKE